MKKLLYCAAALATLLFAGSCQRENLEPAVEGATVTYSVQVPGAMTTKADEDYSGVVNKLVYEVHRVDAEGKTSRLYQDVKDIEKGFVSFDIEFVRNQNFKVLFWAQKDGVYNDDKGKIDLTKVKVPSPLTSNSADYEAFYGTDVVTNGNVSVKGGNIMLTRAVSMLNIGTTAASLNVGSETGNVILEESAVTVKGLPNTLNIMDGVATTTDNILNQEYSSAAVPKVNGQYETFTTAAGESYVYVAKNYVGFAIVDENTDKSTVDVTLTILTDEGPITHEIPSVPLKRNYKTNIVGDLITASAKYSVTLTDEWAGEELVEIWDGETLSQPEFTEETKTWSVNTGAELAWLAQAVNGTLPAVRSNETPDYSEHNIVLTSNVNLGGHEWTPIGTGTKRFSGKLEGNGYAIENFTISEKHAGHPQAALFGNVAGSPTFKNVTISGAKIIYPGEGDFYGAGLVATAYGNLTIENVTVKNCEISGNNKVAGLLAHDGVVSSLKIDNCHVMDCKIESLNEDDGGNVGGLVGLLQAGINHSIKNSSVTNTVINAINSTNTGKRANGEFVACAYGKDNLTVTIENCEVSRNTFTQNEGVTYQSPYGVFVGGYRESDGVPTVVVDGVYYLGYGITKSGNTYNVSSAAGLQKAFNHTDEDDVIVITNDITLAESLSIPEGKKVVLDLNGKTITSGTEDGYAIMNEKGSTLTINDAANEGAINGVVYTETGSSVINGGTYNPVTASAYVFLNYKGTLTINDATINGGSTYAIYSFDEGNKLEINDVTINATFGCVNAYGNNSSIVINDGTFQMTGVEGLTSHIAYFSLNANVTINGGSFEKIGDISMSGTGGGGICANGGADITINGGNFAGDYVDYYNWGSEGTTITIKGGTFKFKPELYIAENYKVVENNGVWNVAVDPAAKIGTTEYASLSEAFEVGGNITLLRDVKVTETLVLAEGKTATLDLNGKTLAHADEANKYAIDNRGTLTITGNGIVNARGIYNGYNNETPVAAAKLTIENGTFNAKGTNGGACVFNYGTAEIKGGSFTSIGGYSLSNQEGSFMSIADGVTANNGIYTSNATLTVNGGTIQGNRSGCHVLYSWNSSVEINGGNFYNYNSGNATLMAAGTSTMIVNDGTFGIKDGRVPGNGNTWTSCLTDTQNSASMTVNGGTFNGGFRVQAGTTMTITSGSFNDCYGSNYNIYGTASVKGGTYTDATAQNFAKKYIAEGYEMNANGEVVAK